MSVDLNQCNFSLCPESKYYTLGIIKGKRKGEILGTQEDFEQFGLDLENNSDV